MKIFEHEYFGKLFLEIKDEIDPVWEFEVKGVLVTLWVGEDFEMNKEILDICADFLRNVNIKLKRSKEEIIKKLKNDSGYIDFHIDKFDNSLPKDVEKFVDKMKFTSIDFWLSSREIQFVIEFAILPYESKEILSVVFDVFGFVKRVDWESKLSQEIVML